MGKVVIIMGSKADLEWAEKISESLKRFEVESDLKVASAHKVPLECYNIIKEEESANTVFITIAGLSNALSGFVDAQTYCPVIACPPVSSSFAGADIYSSLRMPSGVAPMVVLNPDNAALAAAKILGVSNVVVQKKVADFQEKQRLKLKEDNASLA